MKQISVNNFYSYLIDDTNNHKLRISFLAFLTDMWHKYKYGLDELVLLILMGRSSHDNV